MKILAIRRGLHDRPANRSPVRTAADIAAEAIDVALGGSLSPAATQPWPAPASGRPAPQSKRNVPPTGRRCPPNCPPSWRAKPPAHRSLGRAVRRVRLPQPVVETPTIAIPSSMDPAWIQAIADRLTTPPDATSPSGSSRAGRG
jgi:hypothetical protein